MDLNGIDAASVIAVLALLSFVFVCFKLLIRPLEKGQLELRGGIRELQGNVKALEKGQTEIKETLKILLSRQAPPA